MIDNEAAFEPKMRTFDTGATRDTNEGKANVTGCLSPLVVKRYAEYMLKHNEQADGVTRSADNWKKGIPRDAYMESMGRHFLDLWLEHEGHTSRDGLEEALCALIFNAMGYLHETLKAQTEVSTLHDPTGYSLSVDLAKRVGTYMTQTVVSCGTCYHEEDSEAECGERSCYRAFDGTDNRTRPDRWEPKR